jgi:hypothetical protein
MVEITQVQKESGFIPLDQGAEGKVQRAFFPNGEMVVITNRNTECHGYVLRSCIDLGHENKFGEPRFDIKIPRWRIIFGPARDSHATKTASGLLYTMRENQHTMRWLSYHHLG